MTRGISMYSHFMDSRFLKKEIVQGKGAVTGLKHLYSCRWSHMWGSVHSVWTLAGDKQQIYCNYPFINLVCLDVWQQY